jgi:predicted nucleic acid-binding protein
MRLLLDTSVLVDHLRGDSRAVNFLLTANERGDKLWGVTVTRMEILSGIPTGKDRQTGRLLDALSWVDVTTDLADRAAELARRYRGTHPDVAMVDCLVAAAAESLPADLITRNVKRFPMLPHLAPPY